MSATIYLIKNGNKSSMFIARLRTLFLKHPELWVWFFSLYAWSLLVKFFFTASNEVRYSLNSIIRCSPTGIVKTDVYSANGIELVASEVLTTILNGLLPWIIMLIAMMFPLLNEPIRHVSNSVRRKDSYFAILWFLIGYSIVWTFAGMLILLFPLFLVLLVGQTTPFLNALITSSGFLLAAALACLEARPKQPLIKIQMT